MKNGKWFFASMIKKIIIFVEVKLNKICSYHKLLLKVNNIMKNDFLSKEKKCQEFFDLYNFDKETFINLIDFFYFNTKDV